MGIAVPRSENMAKNFGRRIGEIMLAKSSQGKLGRLATGYIPNGGILSDGKIIGAFQTSGII
jgi:hypothetical protein